MLNAKKITIITLTLSTLALSYNVAARDPDKKWTLEEAQASDKAYRDSLPQISHAEMKRRWDENVRITPISNDDSLTQVWAGNSNDVGVRWGQGAYYVEIDFGCNSKGGSVWVSVKEMNDTQVVGIPSPFNYEGNYHITYEHGRMKANQYKTCGSPTIRKISKLSS